jgi:nitrate reductase molybdenum cofactor assembly chaperone NarJ/NarW
MSARPHDFPRALRALAALLHYPDAELRTHLNEVMEGLASADALGLLSPERLQALQDLASHLQQETPMTVEAAYVELFDRGRNTSLHLFEHVHGDSRERGPAMIDLIQTYEQAGLFLAPGELPDHLSVLLEYTSTQPESSARAFLGEFAHLLQAIGEALLRRHSAYAEVLFAVLDLADRATDQAQAAPPPTEEPSLDESWAEPEAFGGCSHQGAQRPDQAHPIHLVRAARGSSHPAQGA